MDRRCEDCRDWAERSAYELKMWGLQKLGWANPRERKAGHSDCEALDLRPLLVMEAVNEGGGTMQWRYCGLERWDPAGVVAYRIPVGLVDERKVSSS